MKRAAFGGVVVLIVVYILGFFFFFGSDFLNRLRGGDLDKIVPLGAFVALLSLLFWLLFQLKAPASQSEESGQTQDKPEIEPFESEASHVPPPRMTSPTGEVVFDYSSHNGHYIIGRGQLEFETQWSKASDTSIHVYNDPPSINGVAVAQGCTSIAQVINAESLDYTSRTRTPRREEIVVLRNVNGFYAAVQVLEIKDYTRNDDRDELRFRYAIQSNGSDNFAEFSKDVVTEPEDGVSAPVPTPADETGRASLGKQDPEESEQILKTLREQVELSKQQAEADYKRSLPRLKLEGDSVSHGKQAWKIQNNGALARELKVLLDNSEQSLPNTILAADEKMIVFSVPYGEPACSFRCEARFTSVRQERLHQIWEITRTGGRDPTFEPVKEITKGPTSLEEGQ